MKYHVIFTSNTGNTELIAKEIFAAIPNSNKDITKLNCKNLTYDADVYFIGFGVNHGTAPMDLLDYISQLSSKKIAFFATCGTGQSIEYYKRMEEDICAWLPDECEYQGMYFCQGKMPIEVRNKYQALLGQGNEEQIKKMIQNFDDGLTHPDNEDIQSARKFAINIVDLIEGVSE